MNEIKRLMKVFFLQAISEILGIKRLFCLLLGFVVIVTPPKLNDEEKNYLFHFIDIYLKDAKLKKKLK